MRAYQKTNAWTRKPSWQMIITLMLMIALIVLHALLVNRILAISHPILLVLFAFNYVFLLAVMIDYLILLTVDPVDPRLLVQDFVESERDRKLLVYCTVCRKNVHVYSYHCKSCQRCAEEFDHHCFFLNVCIGRKNYANFFRIMLTLIFFLIINIGEGIWIALTGEDQRWIAVAMAILAGLILPAVLTLIIFHCYISVCLYKTTLEVIRGELNAEDKRELDDFSPKRDKERGRNEEERRVDTQTSINRDRDGNF